MARCRVPGAGPWCKPPRAHRHGRPASPPPQHPTLQPGPALRGRTGCSPTLQPRPVAPSDHLQLQPSSQPPPSHPCRRPACCSRAASCVKYPAHARTHARTHPWTRAGPVSAALARLCVCVRARWAAGPSLALGGLEAVSDRKRAHRRSAIHQAVPDTPPRRQVSARPATRAVASGCPGPSPRHGGLVRERGRGRGRGRGGLACLSALLDEGDLGGVLGRREVLAQLLHVQLHPHALRRSANHPTVTHRYNCTHGYPRLPTGTHRYPPFPTCATRPSPVHPPPPLLSWSGACTPLASPSRPAAGACLPGPAPPPRPRRRLVRATTGRPRPECAETRVRGCAVICHRGGAGPAYRPCTISPPRVARRPRQQRRGPCDEGAGSDVR